MHTVSDGGVKSVNMLPMPVNRETPQVPQFLAAVTSSQLSNVICVVVRYYGGINLGVGGLIRAYGRCARECLASAKIETQIFYKTLQVRTPYEQIGSVLKLCSKLRGKVVNVEYDQHVTAHLQIRQRELKTFKRICAESTLILT